LFDWLVPVSDAPSTPVAVLDFSAVESDGVVEEGASELAAAVSVGVALESSLEIAVLGLALPVGATSELLLATDGTLVPVENAVIVWTGTTED